MIWYWLILGLLVTSVVIAHRAGMIRIDRVRSRAGRVAAALVVFTGSWMGFDGARALLVGDYVTPGGSGQLGPWANLVAAVGLDPRSGLVKAVLLLYGAASVGAVLAFLSGHRRGWTVLVVVVALGLWYLPFGTVLGVVALILLTRPQVRASQNLDVEPSGSPDRPAM